ncbi:double-stranded RNA-binding protein Staufen homolog 2 isoform X2 [Ornithorhynchus anatinus]|uniref:double-stranded RNA-binding protein Staufen homolog 2 isoform X2 n=1 Tax=Ornithorhynchus anatinus TaxID=9258 RepID=UPI0010A76DBB|nr:double-stranded RNA-binding protein Staufen homolog 2 isoform X2 [Ornithorhynchus anatinus]
MAQVKMQASASLPGPLPAPPPSAPSPPGLPASVNGPAPEPATPRPGPAGGLGDPSPSSHSPAPLLESTANAKEKTPMCLVNELARFNRVQPLYKLLNERGPAHAKMFAVQLTLGEQLWAAEGSSIKKAQHAAATRALTETTLPKPTPRPPKNNVNNNPGSITPTVELNGLAMKRGEPAVYRPLDPKPASNYRANYNFRGMYNQRYHCPVPKIFYVQLTVGNDEFFGEGKTRQAARHNAAMKALRALQNKPIPEKSPQNGEAGRDTEEEKDANKSEISAVFEIALKHRMPVRFEVIKESGPPHMKSFVTRVAVGEFCGEGEGNSKKLSKKRAATVVLQELRKLPPLPAVEKPKPYFKKRPRTILKPGDGKGRNGPKVGFPEPTSNAPKGILHLSPDVYQEMEASRHRAGPVPGAPPGGPAALARDPLLDGSPPAAGAAGLPGVPGPAARPAERLEYLAAIQGFQAALSALKQFSEQGLDPVEGAPKMGNGSLEKAAKHPGEKADGEQGDPGPVARHREDPKPVTATSPL